MKIIKLLCLMVVFLSNKETEALEIGMLSSSSGQMNLEKLRKSMKNHNSFSAKQIVKNFDIPNKDVYFQGWLKYIKVNDSSSNAKSGKKQFFKNDVYAFQEKYKHKSHKGAVSIPTELHFFAVLYKNSLNIFSSMDDTFLQAVDVLYIDDIKPIPEANDYLGGVRDFGKFSEGSCFRVLTKEPLEPFEISADQLEPKEGLNMKWIFCLDNETNKNNVMNLLIKLKLKSQHKYGLYVEVDNGKKENKVGPNLNEMNKDALLSPRENLSDGYWILVQDWSQCTLKCGGGLQYQQLMCVPPKKNGKPCDGPAIRQKPCNTKACPRVIVNSPENKSSNLVTIDSKDSEVLPPILKQMSISSRLSRYDKCVIKEGDALMTKDDDSTKNFSVLPRIPVRVVLNDRTFSVFGDDDLKNLIISVKIEETEFVRVKGEPRCFILKTKAKKKIQLCQLTVKTDWVEEWDYDYNLFKFQCYKPRSKSDVKMITEEDKAIKEELKEHIEQIKVDIVREAAEELTKTVQEEEQATFLTKVETVKKTSFQAIQKETKLEQMIEKEEETREEAETDEIKVQIEHEEKKNELLEKAIKQRQIEDQYNINKNQAFKKIEKIEKETKVAIALKRLVIKKKIAEMRQKQERKKKELESRLISIRTVMADRLGKAAKIGDIKKCFTPNEKTKATFQSYCQNHFSEDYIKFNECNTKSNFCYICCENEFGDLHVLERDKCYNKCDETS